MCFSQSAAPQSCTLKHHHSILSLINIQELQEKINGGVIKRFFFFVVFVTIIHIYTDVDGIMKCNNVSRLEKEN